MTPASSATPASASASSSLLTMTAVLVAAPGQGDRLREALRGLLAPTRQEPGCRDYRLFERIDEPGTFEMHEAFDDEAALEAHRATPHFRAFEAQAPTLLGAPLRLVKLTAVG
ncbi:putative quinol monooxygenase [Roseateles sp.]|uniref:putative quinol monooxygenase n=1 Tax=Roseateles sp. TaxID=1971397 RepID=UPI0031D88042